MEQKIHDLIIVGAGPAGMSASVYASRYGIDHVIIGGVVGGMMSEATTIENWMGENSISGFDLANKMHESVKHAGQEVIIDHINDAKKEEDIFVLTTDLNGVYKAKTVLFASGTVRKKLNIPGEKEFDGKGVCYCATCDAPLYKNKVVAVVGGGNAGVSAAVYLANLCAKVYLIVNTPGLQCAKDLEKQIITMANVEILYETAIKELKGDTKLRQAVLKDNRVLDIDGVFIEIGGVPAKELAEELGVELDERGYVNVGKNQATNIKGVWAAGDIANGSNGLRQIITASAEGAIAVNNIYSYLKNIDLK